ncbi:unnamed protein product [Agarophyton chilense]
MQPFVSRSALFLVPLVALLVSARGAVLPLDDAIPSAAATAQLQSRQPCSLPWNEYPAASDNSNSEARRSQGPHAVSRMLQTKRLVRGEDGFPPTKSVLRQPQQSNDGSGRDTLENLFSSVQPGTPTLTIDDLQTPGSMSEELTELNVEEEILPSPSEIGPITVVNPSQSSSVESGNRDLDDSSTLADNGDVKSITELRDELDSSPEVEEDHDDNFASGQNSSNSQGVEIVVEDSAGVKNSSPQEEQAEESDPEASPSIVDSSSIFDVLPSFSNGSPSMTNGNTEATDSHTPAASMASTDASNQSTGQSVGETTPQDEKSRVQVDISVRSTSVTMVSPELDTHIREYLAEQTDTAAKNWKPVFVSPGEEVQERGTRFFLWVLNYQGMLSGSDLNGDVMHLQEHIFSGGLERFLRSTLSTKSIYVQLYNNILQDVQDRAKVPIEDIGAIDSEKQPNLKESAATGGELGNSGTNNEVSGNNKSRNIWPILGSCLGVLALVAVCVVAFLWTKRSSNSPRHTIDGEEIDPPTLTSFRSMTSTDSTPSRFQTGAPVNPRGATVLRNQSRLLDWRAEQAGGAEHESRVEILE